MFSKKCLAGIAVALSMILPFSAIAKQHTRTSLSDDEIFLALRDASRNNDAQKADALSAQLKNYPIPSYVDYYRLRPRLAELPEAEIRGFLKRYEGHAIADRFRNDWLLELGKARNWQLFDEQYPLFVLNDDTQVKCYALMSQAAKGNIVINEARALLVNPKYYGDGCRNLIAFLVQIRQFSEDDLWAQLRLASESNASTLFRQLAELAGVSPQTAEQVFAKPEQFLAQNSGNGRIAQELFVVALGRLARTDPEKAAAILVAALPRLPAAQQAQGWAQIALRASLKLMPSAVDYWRRTEKAALTHDAHEWKVRMALRAQDWPLVKAAIEAMPPALRDNPAWIYWRGRAYQAEGKQDIAQNLFKTISGQIGFYGQLALEELGETISIPGQAAPLGKEEIDPMASNEGFRRALKFFAMDLRFEGVREWNWELRRMNDRQLLAAAEFARRSNVLDRMVNTSDRTVNEHDFGQRFPTPFKELMKTVTQPLDLENALVYGLIRQESRFIMNARSSVGASGLMQLMPGTARYVARKLGMNNFSQERVNDTEVNLRLGTAYLSMVLNSLDGSQVLATAAYNAGPRRSTEWRAALAGPVEGAIFAESIPFSETRGYVKSVLSNATYYAALAENKGQSLKARLGIIEPKQAGEVSLP